MKKILLLCLLYSWQTVAAQCPAGNTFTVTNNSGTNILGSLTRACQCVNSTPALTTINFAIPSGSLQIQPATELVISANGILVDGTSQSGIIIDGSSVAGAPAQGLRLTGTNNTVQGLTIRNFTATFGGHGIRIDANGNTVVGNTLHNNRNGVNTTTPVTTALITNNNIYCNTIEGINRASGPALPTISANTQNARGTAPANAEVQVFVHNTTGCAGAPCQGKTLVGTTTASPAGVWQLNVSSGMLIAGQSVTATSTLNGNNTSEFATCNNVLDCSSLSVNTVATTVSCFGGMNGTAMATGTGGSPLTALTYRWNTGAMTANISNLAPAIYTVTVSDAAGCTATETATVGEPSMLTVAFIVQGISCFGGTNGALTAVPGGGTPIFSYNWNTGQTGATISNLPPAIYTVTVTDNNGCFMNKNIQLTQPVLLTLGASASPESTAAAHDGTATATAGGGTPGYTYVWSNGAITAQTGNLAPGTYTVTVTDNNGCTRSASATVNAGPGGGPCSVLPVYAVLVPSQVCGNTTLSLEIDDLYPSPAVSYVWFFPNGDSATTLLPSLDILATSTDFSGEYFVARDSAGCRSVLVGGAPVTVLSLDPAQVFAGNDSLLCTAGVVVLKALAPPQGSGTWVSVGGATIDNPSNAVTAARNLQTGANAFIWQVSLGNCTAAAADTVVFFLEKRALLNDDHYTLQRAQDIAVMEVLLNDALAGLSDTVVSQIGAPAFGLLEYLEDGRRFRYTVQEDYRGSVQFQYAVCSPASTCNFPCDTATVTIDIQNLPVVPEGLVIDDPGANGRMTIKGINGFTRVEISVFNRWGTAVFQEKNYRNDNPWLGHFKGKALPDGAYYYYLKVFDGDVLIGGTLTGIIHLFQQQ